MEKYIVKLTAEERDNLTALTKFGKHAASKILHAKILLMADIGDSTTNATGMTDDEVATVLDVHKSTVKRIRKKLVMQGLDAALSRRIHSATRPRKILGTEEARLIAICCSDPPEGRSRWTLKLLSDKLVEMEVLESVSPATVGRVFKKKRIEAMAEKRMVHSRSKC
jgi:transposase